MVAGSGIPLDRSSSSRHLGEVQHYNTIFRQLTRVTYHVLRPYCCACISLSGQFSCMPSSPHMLSVFVDVYDCMSCCAVGTCIEVGVYVLTAVRAHICVRVCPECTPYAFSSTILGLHQCAAASRSCPTSLVGMVNGDVCMCAYLYVA